MLGLEELGLHRREAPERELAPGGLSGQTGEQPVLALGGKVGFEDPARCRSESNEVRDLERGVGNEHVEDLCDDLADGRNVLGIS